MPNREEEHPVSSVINNAWGQAAAFSIGSICLSVGQIAMAPLLTRRLSVSQYGTYEILLASYIAMRTLLLLPLSSALIYGLCKYSHTDDERKGLLGTMSLLSLLISAMFVILGISIPQWPSWFIHSESNLTTVGLFILFSLGLETSIQLGLGGLRAAQQPVLYGLVAISQLFGTLAMTAVFLGFYNLGLEGVFGSFLAGNLLAIVVLIPVMSSRISKRFNWVSLRPMMILAMTLVPVSLANLILSISDRYFLNSFSSLAILGVYGLSYKIGSGASMLVAVPFATAWPAIIFSEKESDRIGELVSRAALYLWGIGMLSTVMVSSAAKPLLLLFGGQNFLPGAYLIPIISTGGLLFGVTGILLSSVVAQGRLRWNMIAMLVVSALVLILNALLIPNQGMLGAALATILAYLFGLVLSVLLARRFVTLNYEISKWIKIAISGLIAIFFGKLMEDLSMISIVNVVGATLVSAFVYSVLLRIWKVIPPRAWNTALSRSYYHKLFPSSGTPKK
jgi:O-antigen/teichoic acid export membrane protein